MNKNIKSNISQLCTVLRPVATTVFLFGSMLSLLFNPMNLLKKIGYVTFDRVIGQATQSGINADLRIQLYMLFNLLLIPLFLLVSAFVCFWFVRKIKDKRSDPNIKEALSFLDSSSICAIILVLTFIINKYASAGEGITIPPILAMPLMIALSTLFYLRFPTISFKVYRFGMIVSLSVSLFISLMFQNNTESSLYRFYIIYIAVTVLTQLLLIKTHFNDFDRLAFATAPLSYAMLFTGFTLELFNILNRHNIFIINRVGGAKIVFSAFLVLSILIFIFSDKAFLKRLKMWSHWETVCLAGLILSFVYFGNIPPLSIGAGTELFETANHGLLVNDLLLYGKFPIINSFDAHTLQHSLGCILYGLLNDDVLGAAYFGYTFVWSLITALFSFVVFKELFDKYFAFFLAIIVPVTAIFPDYFNVGVICIAALLAAIRKRSFSSYLLMFFSILLTLLYNIPVGFSYGGAVLIVSLANIIHDDIILAKKNIKKSSLLPYIKALAVFAGITVICYTAICLFQHINPIKRAAEFLSIASSTNNWSYTDIGDPASLNYGLVYSFMPFAVVICIIWLLTHFKNSGLWYTSLAVLVAYVFNITRTLQRHTLVEGQLRLVLGLSLLGITLFFATYLNKHKKIVFAALGTFLLLGMFNVDAVQTAVSPAATAITAFSNSANYYDGSNEKVTRVDMTAPLTTYSKVLSMINTTIPEGETYLDLTGNTMLYALSGREKPVYANQSVTELSGEYSQKRLIEEVEEDYDGICDFALVDFNSCWMNIDGVSCFARYYYVLEYLYDNYQPLCKTDNWALWVRKSRYEEFTHNDSVTDVYTISLPHRPNDAYPTNDLCVENADHLRLVCGEADPFIAVTFDKSVIFDYSKSADYYAEMTFKSDTSGMFQLYFDYEGFNEAHSTLINVFASEKYNTVRIPVPYYANTAELHAIRIDPPSNSIFEISSLKFISVASNESTFISLAAPIFRAGTTDMNWTNGVFNTDPKRMVFERASAEQLLGATTLLTAEGTAKVTNIIADDNWIQITTDKDASFFDNGITGVSTTGDIKNIDYDYLGYSHGIELGKIPYVWGQFDEKKAWRNPIVYNIEGSAGELDSEVQQQAKYVLMSVNSPIDGRAALCLQNLSHQNVTEYSFDLKKGINRYIIRCSADYNWNRDMIRYFDLQNDTNAVIQEVCFLEGD